MENWCINYDRFMNTEVCECLFRKMMDLRQALEGSCCVAKCIAMQDFQMCSGNMCVDHQKSIGDSSPQCTVDD